MRCPLPEDPISSAIISAAFKVHSVLGPGLLEHAYKVCLAQELRLRQKEVFTEVEVPLCYEGVYLNLAYRIDLLVEQSVVVEIKSVDKIEPIHIAQLLSCLRLSKKRVGLLINFKNTNLRHGLKRVLNGFDAAPPQLDSIRHESIGHSNSAIRAGHPSNP